MLILTPILTCSHWPITDGTCAIDVINVIYDKYDMHGAMSFFKKVNMGVKRNSRTSLKVCPMAQMESFVVPDFPLYFLECPLYFQKWMATPQICSKTPEFFFGGF